MARAAPQKRDGRKMYRFGKRLRATRTAALGLLAATLVLCGCMTRRDDIAYAPADFARTPDSVFQSETEYRLGPSDVVSVAVFRAPELTGNYRVDAAGNINMPLVGAVQVQGQSLAELSGTLEQRLGSRYYVDPDVTVSLMEIGSQRVTVDGAVAAPGLYPLAGRATLMQVVAMARGTTLNANTKRVIVFRQIDGRRMAAGFDLNAIRSNQMEDPVIYGSDIVVVDGDDARQMWREVLSAIPILALFRPITGL
jgi:polysaccharide biosynthesis/export protein